MSYDFKHEAWRVCSAIDSTVGNMTVQCALREAFDAGQHAAFVEGFQLGSCGASAEAAEAAWQERQARREMEKLAPLDVRD